VVVRATQTPGIPDIRDDNIAEVLRAIKSTLEVRERRSGDELDGFVRFRDLEDLNLADSSSGGDGGAGGGLPVGPVIPGGPGGGYNPGTDFTTPPAPTGFMVYPVFSVIHLNWDGAPYANHAYTEIWRAQVDDLSQALMIGTAVPSVYADASVDFDTEYWYWIRFTSKAGITGPYNSTSGTYGRTGRDIGKAIEALSGEIVNSALWTELSQRIGKIEVDGYIANRSVTSKLEYLEARDMLATSRIFTLDSVSNAQATRLTVLESHGPTANRTFFTPERPDAESHGVVNDVPLLDGDVWYDTDESHRSYRWIATGWQEFTIAGGNKVYHQPNDPATWDGTDYVDIDGRKIIDGDLWYDADDGNHPYRWKGDEFVWKDFSSGDASAEVITLEQTKIGYATLNRDSTHGYKDSVFDHNGLIWNNVPAGDPAYPNSVQNWNAIHTDTGNDSMLTWHVGLPFAHATKHVGITSGGNNATVEQNFVAMKQVDSGLLAQYSVKIDINGYVAGFGLSSSLPEFGTGKPVPDSKFIVRADTFSLAPPQPPNPWISNAPYAKGALVWMAGGPSNIVHSFQSRVDGNVNHQPIWGAVNTPTKPNEDPYWNDLVVRLPFIATTTAQTIDGKTYPPGVWINSANIFDAQIVSAMIETLTASKIATGSLIASIGIDTGQIYGGVNPAYGVGQANFGSGFYLGYSGQKYKFFCGDALTSYVLWDGTKFEVKGHIIGTSGSIGGINMSFGPAPQYIGMLYTTGVTGASAGDGFYLDSTSYMRIGSATLSRMVWDKTNLTIYGSTGQVLLATGSGINWGSISGVPSTIQNSSITITPHGTLNGAGGGQVIAHWIGAAEIAGGNAPTLRNNQVNITRDGPNGGIILQNAGINSAYGIIMPDYKIRIGNIGTYMESMAVSNAYIADLAVGFAEIAGLSVDTGHIRNAAVQTLQIGGEAVIIPRYAKFKGVPNANPALDTRQKVGKSTVVLLNGKYDALALTLNTAISVLVFTFTTEITLADVNDTSTYRLTCFLSGAQSRQETFAIGMIDNAPTGSHTCVFSFDNLPAGGYWSRIEAIKIAGNATAHYVDNQHFIVQAAKR